MPNINPATDASFETEILRSDIPTVVQFWASWSGPARAAAPIFDALAGDYADKIKLTRIDVDENPQTPSSYGIMAIPTLLLFINGTVVDQLVGAVSRTRLESFLERAIAE
ncbi:MAG: thioredoxin [Bradymonadaceae bacterium]|nr:thioredoxin [Lujinxingiaceae bacterium]